VERYEVPVAWFRAIRGVRIIVSAGWFHIMDSKLRPLLLDPQPEMRVDHVSLSINFTELLVGVTSSSAPEHGATYECAVNYLHWIYVLSQHGERPHSIRRKLLAFPGKVPSTFISLLETSDPGALVITAHFFGLLRTVDDLWWLQGMAEREISGLLTIVPENWIWGNGVASEASTLCTNSHFILKHYVLYVDLLSSFRMHPLRYRPKEGDSRFKHIQ